MVLSDEQRMLVPPAPLSVNVTLRELLSETGSPRTRIVFRKDSIYVHPTINQPSPRTNSSIPSIPLQKRHDNIPGCIFLIEEQPQKQSTPKTSPRNDIKNDNESHDDITPKNKLYFTWTPYSLLASVNDKLVAHTKENGEIVTAKNFISSSPMAVSPNDQLRLKVSSQRHQKSRSASDIPPLDNLLTSNVTSSISPLDTRNLSPDDGYVSAAINGNKQLTRDSTGIINSLSPTHHKTVQQHQLMHQQAKEQQNMQDLYAILSPVTDIAYFKRHIPTMGTLFSFSKN
jgi:hypothetical protein